MALLTRKGGGLPANYREVHFWLNHVEAPVESQEPEPAGVGAETQLAEGEAVLSAVEMAAAETRPEIKEAAAETVAAADEPAEVKAAETAQAEEVPAAEAADASTEEAMAADVAATDVATEATSDVVGNVEVAEATPEAGLGQGEAVEAKAAEVAEVEEPIAEMAEAVSESEPAKRLADVRELPKRGGTMLGLNEESATEQNTAEEGEAEEKGRSRGFLGFRRRKRA